MRCLCPFLSQRGHEDGRERKEDHPSKDLQGFDGPVDERERKNVEIFKFQAPAFAKAASRRQAKHQIISNIQ
jgi:hypothetical protein